MGFRELKIPRAVSFSFALVATYGCSGGLSCGGGASGCGSAYQYPQTAAQVPNGTEFVDDGVRMRMTQQALDYVVDNIRPILGELLGNDPNNPNNLLISSTAGTTIGAGFTVGVSDGSPPDEVHPTEIYIDAAQLADGMVLEFVGDDAGEPTGVHLVASNVPLGIDARIFFDFGIGNAACDLFGTNPTLGSRPFLTTLSIDAVITPRVGNGAQCDGGAPECLKIDVNVNSATIGSFGAGDIAVEQPPSPCASDGLGACSEVCSDQLLIEPADLECTGVCFVGDIFVDIAAGLFDLLSGLVNAFLPTLLEAQIRNVLADFDGAPIALSNRLDVAGFAPGVLPVSALDLGFAIGPTAGAFNVNDPAGIPAAVGMDFTLKSGFEAAPALPPDDTLVPNPCVRTITGNDFAALYDGFRFEAPPGEPLTGAYDGTVYSVGLSVAKATINQVMFAMYNTGALCIETNTDAVHALTGGGFPLTAGLIDTLTGGRLRQFAKPDAPVIIAIAPSQPPVLTYGAGTEEEGHLIVDWPAVEVSFYVLMNERFARVFAVNTDISLQLSVFNDPDTQTLRIAVVDGPNVDNFQERYNELLPGVAFSEVLDALVGSVFDAALGDGIEFNYDIGSAIADSFGIPLYVNFVGLETTPTVDPEFLNVYLQFLGTNPNPVMRPTAGLHIAERPDVFEQPEGQRLPHTTGHVDVQTDGDDATEYFAKVDYGAWRGPLRAQPDGTLRIKDGKLRLTGEHLIDIKARAIGYPNSLQPVGEALSVWVDAQAPRVTLKQLDASLVAEGSDDGTPTADLRYQWQTDDDGVWTDADGVRPLRELNGRRIAVRAIDRAGNISVPFGIDLQVARQRVDDEMQARSGCAQTGASSALTSLAALVLLRRRRARTA